MGKLRATHLNDLCGMSVMMVFMEWESVDDKLGNGWFPSSYTWLIMKC